MDKPEQQVLVRNIQANEQRLKQVFDSVASTVGSPSQNQSAALDPAFLQVSWSRMAVQSQGLVSDASRLSQLLRQQTDQLRETRTMLIYSMVSMFGLFLLASYMLTYRRILKSISTLQAGTAVIGSGNLDFAIKEKKNDEIGDLSRAFNRMTANLKDVTASKADLEREITERKQAEEDLRQQREWLRVTLSSIGDAVIASDTEGRITFLNPVAVTLTGWQSEEALGQPIQSIFRIINEKTREPAEDLVARVLHENAWSLWPTTPHWLPEMAAKFQSRTARRRSRTAPVTQSAWSSFSMTSPRSGAHRWSYVRRTDGRSGWRGFRRKPQPGATGIRRWKCSLLQSGVRGGHGWACEVGQPLQNKLLPLVGQAMAEKRGSAAGCGTGRKVLFCFGHTVPWRRLRQCVWTRHHRAQAG